MLAWGRAAFGALWCALIVTPHATAQSPVPVVRDVSAPALEPRIEFAAHETLASYREWLGPPPVPLTIVDRPGGDLATIRVHPSWIGVPPTMEVEAEVAFELARRWWRDAPPSALMIDGASWYLQSRALARLFDLVHQHDGHGVDAVRLFGGYYPIAFPQLRFDGPGAGLGRPLLGAPARPVSGVRYPRAITASVVRVAYAFASLERLTGWPRLSGALRVAVSQAITSNDDLIRILGDALGQDVAWLFEPALDPAATWSYAITGVVEDACQPQPCSRTRVAVVRLGSAAFTGQSDARAGEFLSGDALQIRARFADGQLSTAAWDGRDQERTFTFEGPAAVTEVRLDPASAMLVDDNWLDQARVLNGATNAPVVKWISRWVIWLQHAMLTYNAIV